MWLMRWKTILSSLLATSGALAQSGPKCQDYAGYAGVAHEPRSSGPLQLPLMRPPEECRTFTSPAVEQVIKDMSARLKDPDVARLFENTFPSTLDTTVKYFGEEQNLAFIITGDISAQWLRDTANQFAHLQPILLKDKKLQTLVRAVINNEARYISQFPYCGAFQPPPESGLPTTHNDWADGVSVFPPVNNQVVFECKYEIDSLCGFLKLSRSYWQNTNDRTFINGNWTTAISQIFQVMNDQSKATFDDKFNLVRPFTWTGGNGALSPPVNNAGIGEPKGYTGMVGTHHRPSDDLSTFAFLTPANAMLSVELDHLATMLETIGTQHNVSTLAREWSHRIKEGIEKYTLQDDIYAYETNGLGGRYFMDDANVPSLLSLPYLGYLDRKDPRYVKTREALLSRQNPYFSKGEKMFGIGGPHVNAWSPWPMSLISSIYGTDDDATIMQALYTIVNNTAGLGLIHEAVDIYSGGFTRPWFAWANSYFAEMLLDLGKRKPGLIFKENKPYNIADGIIIPRDS